MNQNQSIRSLDSLFNKKKKEKKRKKKSESRYSSLLSLSLSLKIMGYPNLLDSLLILFFIFKVFSRTSPMDDPMDGSLMKPEIIQYTLYKFSIQFIKSFF